MRGGIVKRNEKFYVVTDIATGPTGKRRQKWHASYPTRKQAEKELRKIFVELDEQRYVEPSAKTLSTYLLETCSRRWRPPSARAPCGSTGRR